MIPVLFGGKIVGWLPSVVLPRGRPTYEIPVYRRLMPGPKLTDWNKAGAVPMVSVIRFEVRDQKVGGVPGELHVASLYGLLDLPTFAPEDRWLADLTAQRLKAE